KRRDIVVGNSQGRSVSIVMNAGDGGFADATTIPVSGYLLQQVAIADLDGDKQPDVLAISGGVGPADPSHGTLDVMLGQGDGTFTSLPAVLLGTAPATLGTGDFNGDGSPDLVVAYGIFGHTADVMLGRGDGTFAPPVSYETGYAPEGLVVG